KMAEKEDSGDPGKDKNDLQLIELYHFRDSYFETHSLEEAGRKQSDVTQEMERTLKKLEEKEESCKHKAEFLLQKGRCLNVTPDFSAVAEECLSRTVKLEPSLVEAWNLLGDNLFVVSQRGRARQTGAGECGRSPAGRPTGCGRWDFLV
uniref:Tetratricopeptide repeat domain 5 n=1 Tax=Nothobranchius furzeri TaxID=105023 RepID=A0A8C6KDS6_NOTFU